MVGLYLHSPIHLTSVVLNLVQGGLCLCFKSVDRSIDVHVLGLEATFYTHTKQQANCCYYYYLTELRMAFYPVAVVLRTIRHKIRHHVKPNTAHKQ
jgi:hypothetical protein